MVRDTSVAAWEAVNRSGYVTKQKRVIYNGLYEHGPATGSELFHKLDLGTVSNQSNILTRLGELREMGIVMELPEKRLCNITKQTVIVWDVTSNHPRPLPVRKSRTQEAVENERECCAAIAFESGDIVGAIIGNKIRARGST